MDQRRGYKAWDDGQGTRDSLDTARVEGSLVDALGNHGAEGSFQGGGMEVVLLLLGNLLSDKVLSKRVFVFGEGSGRE